MRQKLRLMLFEFDSMRETLTDAKKRGFYASAFRLPADEWARSREELTKHHEVDDVMDVVKAAYERAHQFNVLVGPHLLDDLTVLEDDPIDETLESVARAEAALKAEIARRTPS